MLTITRNYIQNENWKKRIRFYEAYYWFGYDPIVFNFVNTADYVENLVGISGLEQGNRQWGVYATRVAVFPDCQYYTEAKTAYVKYLEHKLKLKLNKAKKRFERGADWQVSLSFYFDLLEYYKVCSNTPIQFVEVKKVLEDFPAEYDFQVVGDKKLNDTDFVTVGCVSGFYYFGSKKAEIVLEKVYDDYFNIKRRVRDWYYKEAFNRKIPLV